MAEDKYQYTARKMEDAKKYIERSLHLLFEDPPEYDRITRVLGDEVRDYFSPSFTEGFVEGATDFLNKRINDDLYDERGYAEGIDYAQQVFEKEGLVDERIRKYGGYTNRRRQSGQRQLTQVEREIRIERMRDEILEMIHLAEIEHELDEDELQQLHEEYYENSGTTIEQVHATILRLDRYLQGLDEAGRHGDGRYSTQPYEERRIDLSIGNLL